MTLYLCDDQSIFRDGLKTYLSLQSNLEIIGQSEGGPDTVAAVLRLNPKITIIDLSMQTMDGTEIIHLLRLNNSKTKIIVLSQHSTQDWIKKLLKIGIDSYLLKSDGRDFLLDAIWSVCKGEHYFSPTIANTFYEILLNSQNKTIPRSLTTGLSPREKEVALFTSKGLTVREIAKTLDCSENTIKTHKTNMMKKIQAKNSAEVTSWVIHHL